MSTVAGEPSRLQRAVSFWSERLAPAAAGTARPELERQLTLILRALYQGGDLGQPARCPVTTPDALRQALRALEEVAGVAAEQVNALVLRLCEVGERTLGWRLPEPVAVVLRLPRELPVLVEDDFVALAALTRLEAALDRAAPTLPSWPVAARAGHVLHRALVLGGLLRLELISGWLALQPQDFTVTAHGSWVMIPVAPPPGADALIAGEPRAERWLLRPELELLLHAFWRDFPQGSLGQGARPWALLRAYYTAAGIEPAWQPRTFAQCRRWARARQAVGLSPLLLAVLTGGVRTCALPAVPYRRLLTGEPAWQADDRRTPVVKPAVTGDVFIALPDAPRPLPTQEDRAVKRILACLRRKPADRAAVRRELAARWQVEERHLGLAGRVIVHWLQHLLTHETKTRAVSTISRYVQPVRRYVLPQLRRRDPATLSGEDWRRALQEAIDGANDALAPLAIYLFARFVTVQPGGPDFDVAALEGLDRAFRVRPNLIAVSDFERAMAQLQAPDQRDQRMARLIGALAFYAGLRRGEALHLCLGDLQGAARLWLTVSNNRHRRLKSHASQRLLPLADLLPAAWHQELLGWRSQRHAEGGARAREQLLFCALGKPAQPLPAERLITPVCVALRAVTGDDSLVFHHLRHSFASWTLIRLLAPELPLPRWQHGIAALAPAWFAPPACAALRQALLGATDPQPVRHAGYALARLLGHQRVATTLRSYIHLADLLILGMQTRQEALALGDAEVCALLGLNPPGPGAAAANQRWRRLRQQARSAPGRGLNPRPILQAAHRQGPLPGVDYWPTTPPAATPGAQIGPPAVTEHPLRLEQVPGLLNALYQPDPRLERIARDFTVAPLTVQRLQEAALALGAQRTPAGNPRFPLPPHPPHRRSDGDALATVVKRLDAGEVDWPTIAAGITLLDRCDPSHGHRLLVRDDADAHRFLALLVALGFPPGRVRVDLYPQPGAEAENQRHWCRCLGLPAAAMTLKSPVRAPGATHGAIALGVTSRRACSRLPSGPPADGDYDPARARRVLAWFDARAQGDTLSWALTEVREQADLAWLLGWFGVPATAIAQDPARGHLTVACAPPVAAATVRRARRLLAQALPYHNLRVVSADPGDIQAVITLLLACGVARAWFNVDFTGPWEPAVSSALMQDLARDFGLERQQLPCTPRRRQQATAKLSLTVSLARGWEPIHAWSLTYALIMVRLFTAACR